MGRWAQRNRFRLPSGAGHMLKYLVVVLLFCVSLSEFSLEAIGSVTRTFYDASRQRPLITTFWYPEPFESRKLHHLVVLSHDTEGSRLELAWLAEFLAENGYLVASTDHYGDTHYLKLPGQKEAHWDRPRDVTSLIGALRSDPQFGIRFKHDKVVVLGYSTGALTALWLAGAKANKHPQKNGTLLYKDSSVRAAILISPGHGNLFDADGLLPIKIPVLVIAPQNDAVYPLFTNAMFFGKFIPNAKYVKVKGIVSHDFVLCPDHFQKIKLKKTILEFIKDSIK